VESGLLTLVGGTTEHPGMEVNNALLSRAQVYTLQPLDKDEMRQLYERAVPHLGGVALAPEALELLAQYADGDGRRFLNLVEQVGTAAQGAGRTTVDVAFAQGSTSPSLRRFDKGGDELYMQLSAFHKSLRGSQPDAALYWLARILDGGGDGRQVARRMIAMASEDIGNADPRALQLAINAAEAYERLGSPEGELALAQATTYLAVAAKSNAAYLAWNQAKAFVRATGSRPVPIHLRNAPSKLMKQMGYGAAYRYAHDEPDAYAAGQSYFPDDVEPQRWYQPTDRGLDARIRDKLAFLRGLDDAAGQPQD
jgi:putative ATPase